MFYAIKSGQHQHTWPNAMVLTASLIQGCSNPKTFQQDLSTVTALWGGGLLYPDVFATPKGSIPWKL
ncbi:hypothetical protein L2764_06220 [Shewanella surugensis]|uniref:Uncharacterized protein n=1 Tax=Shewanella surugensis TaxID=212020 RepID=A0ABT0L8Q4_9GAMM|nr:hypothetical protein [Shewanella surugensis]